MKKAIIKIISLAAILILTTSVASCNRNSETKEPIFPSTDTIVQTTPKIVFFNTVFSQCADTTRPPLYDDGL